MAARNPPFYASSASLLGGYKIVIILQRNSLRVSECGVTPEQIRGCI